MPKRLFLYASALGLFIVQIACGFSRNNPIPDTPTPLPKITVATTPPVSNMPAPSATLIIPIPSPTLILFPSPTLTATPTPTPNPTDTSTITPTPTITPTYAVLRGQVIPDKANCRYGPGWMYLYKYGLVGGSNLEIIGRTDLGDWVLIQAIGGNNPCWVKADLMNIKGEVLAVAPVDVHTVLPWSPYYGPLTNVSATRDGDTVTVSWSSLVLRAGDEADPVAYVLEAWVCHNGQLVFAPDGSFQTAIKVVDEPGCDEPSHGRVMAAEKHGYTLPVEVVWP